MANAGGIPAAFGRLDGPANWLSHEIGRRADRILELDAPARAELRTIAERAAMPRTVGAPVPNIQPPPLRLSALLHRALDRLEYGCGFQILRGFTVDELSEDETRNILIGIGSWMGIPLSQNQRGELLSDVQEIPAHDAKGRRRFETSMRFYFHTDVADVTGLLCLEAAKTGGQSGLVSAIAIHNEIARRQPELLDVLYQPFIWSWRGRNQPDQKPYFFASDLRG